MSQFKKGMYVRCPIDEEDPANPRKFVLGQIVEKNIIMEEVTVYFHDFKNGRQFFRSIPEKKVYDNERIQRCKILNNSEIRLSNGDKGIIIKIALNQSENDFYNYYINVENKKEIQIINEAQIKAKFTRARINPIRQLKNYEFHNPIWYKKRTHVSNAMQALNSATFGFDVLLGSRMQLFPHQVDTIMSAITMDRCRLMLADEVGLGKTIEASVIMKGLKKRKGNLKTLIIVPDSLDHQWQNELSHKLWLEIPIYGKDEYDPKENSDLIFPFSKLDSLVGKLILDKDWDICIIDETHRLMGMKDEYDEIKALSKRVKHFLLLTATPIQKRKNEYLKLLSLLKPDYYGKMSEEEFNKILNKEEEIVESIHPIVRDLDEYYEGEQKHYTLEDLEYIANNLDDDLLNEIVNNIDLNSEDEGLSDVKTVLKYIGEYYQIDNNISRHRRIELKDKLPSRTLESIEYYPAASDYQFYELDVYEELLNYLQMIINNSLDNNMIGEYIKIFLSSMFSSPWSLSSLLNKRKKILNTNSINLDNTDSIHFLNSPRKANERKEKIISSVETFLSEKQLIKRVLKLNRKWEKASYEEFNNLDELYNYPDKIKGRLVKIIDYLSQELDTTKFVLFTNWSETLEKMEELLKRKFGSNSYASFHSGKTNKELQKEADLFQSDPECRFMLCDELGGEGRNFQIADGIIHIDLPWSPMQLEQRIGRLDRVGRNKSNDVLSIVFYAKDTLEENLFQIWNKGLNVFNESLSGLEIILENIDEEMSRSLVNNLKYGLENAVSKITKYIEEMKDQVERYQYLDSAKNLDIDLEIQLKELIDKFDESGKISLKDIMLSWANLTGLKPSYVGKSKDIVLFKKHRFSIKSIQNTMMIPPDMQEAKKRAKRSGEVRGTFSRDVAINREDLIFFAPGDPLFDRIVKNALECSRGWSTSYVQFSDIDWKGFVFNWSIKMNLTPLIEKGIALEKNYLGQGYLPLENIISIIPLTEKDKKVDRDLILANLKARYNKKDYVHLGKRSKRDRIISKEYSNNLSWFKDEFDYDFWQKKCEKAYKFSFNEINKKVEELVDLDRAKDDFEYRLAGEKASKLYYEKENISDDKIKKIYNSILEGLKNPDIKLDSVSFVWMVKK